MSEKLEHARHRTYFLASTLGVAVLSVPAVFILMLEGSWDINTNFLQGYALIQLMLVVVAWAERKKMHEKE